jgi:acetylornithine deacetylase/succinyl-diaminopimelate desuccinylase-like protein
VVPVSDEDKGKWKHGPWAGEIAKDRMYGRGTTDMKSGVLAMMVVAETLAERTSLPTDVWFTFVVEEETDGSGTRAFVDWFRAEGWLDTYREIVALIPEPTGMDIERGNRGNIFVKAEVRGDTGHSSRPGSIKRHAIKEMFQFALDLEQEAATWPTRFRNSEFGPPTLAFTSISAESGASNTIAGVCTGHFDLRTVPGFHQEGLDKIKEVARARQIEITLDQNDAPAAAVSPDSKIVKIAQSIRPDAKLTLSTGGTDLGFFTQARGDGPEKITGIVLGPGNLAVAHGIDEWVDLGELNDAPGIYEQIYDAWANEMSESA